jgi:hypothetical protein
MFSREKTVLLICAIAKNSSFANFGRGRLLRFANVLLCAGFPNCPEGQKRVGKNYFFLHRPSINAPIQSINYFDFQSFYQCTTVFLALHTTARLCVVRD